MVASGRPFIVNWTAVPGTGCLDWASRTTPLMAPVPLARGAAAMAVEVAAAAAGGALRKRRPRAHPNQQEETSRRQKPGKGVHGFGVQN